MCEPGVPVLEYDVTGGPNRGSLCAKGNVSLELMTHPRRLEAPSLREGDRTRPIAWDEALAWAGARLARVRAVHGGAAVGILLGPHLTDEEAAAAARLARAIGTPHVDLCEPEDHAVLRGVDLSSARPARVERVEQIDQMDALLVVGDLLTVAPCAARPVLNARYRERRHTIAMLAPTKTRTAWFGRPAVRCEPNGEAPALTLLLKLALETPRAHAPAWAEKARAVLARWAVEDLEVRAGVSSQQAADLVRALQGAAAAGVLMASQFGATARVDLVAGLAALLAEAVGARFLAMLEGANSAGIRAVLAAEGYPGPSGHTTPELLEAAVTGDVRALLVFGADPVAACPGSIATQAMHAVPLAVVTAPLPGPTTEAAHLILPAAVFGEKPGTTRGAFGTPTFLSPAMAPPGDARPDLEVIERLAAAIPSCAAPAMAAEVTPVAPGVPFFAELDVFLRAEGREATHEPGTHLLLAESSATNAAEGSLTRQLSWARYAFPHPLLAVPAPLAAALGVRSGDRVRVRSNWGEAELPVRVDPGLPDGVVTAPHRDPAVRGLLRWRREPVLRGLDLRPERISLERVAEVARA
jgi:predicted molibdopterin-dependent oxidoreductase YjgC